MTKVGCVLLVSACVAGVFMPGVGVSAHTPEYRGDAYHARSVNLLAPSSPYLPSAAVGAACRAQVTSKSATIDDGDVFSEFTVRPSEARGYVSGMIEFRVHYTDKKSARGFYSGMAKWSLDTTEGIEANEVDEGFESLCANRTLGPCRVQTVEILRVSCY